MRVVHAFVIAAVVLGGAHPTAAQTTFTTLAGMANRGSTDGTGAEARYYLPNYLTVDSATGNVYVADTSNHTIRKITPAGVVTTLAGLAGASGSVDGAGSAARFSFPYGIALNSSTGVLYVAEGGSHIIRAITPAGVVTTIAGLAGSSGSTDGAGAAARFNAPTAITVNVADGMIYVADTNNHTIRAVTPGGMVTTLAGVALNQGTADGNGTAARFRFPRGVSVNPASGVVYVADTNNNTIRLITSAGEVTTWVGVAGQCGILCAPVGVWVDSVTWTVYVGDSGYSRIARISPAGVVSTLAGAPPECGAIDGTGSAARFCSPIGVAFNSTTGILYVADFQNNAIRTVTAAGVVSTFASVLARGAADGTGSNARFNTPNGIAVNPATGTIYVADTFNHTIRSIAPGGVVTTLAGLAGTAGSANGVGSVARFNAPRDVAVDSSTGTIYVADAGNHTIRAVTPAGAVSTLAGMPGSAGSSDGTGTTARFSSPSGIAFNSGNGMVYVADTNNHTIRLVTAGSTVTTWAGLAGVNGLAEGAGSAARFRRPEGIDVDAATWTAYVADSDNGRVRRITPAGVVSTLAQTTNSDVDFFDGIVYVSHQSGVRSITADGVVREVGGGSNGAEDGVGPAAQFVNAFGIAVDAAGTLYVADSSNHTIRLGETLTQVTGDFDGDGETDPALFGPSSGRWHLNLSSTATDVKLLWGIPGDMPVPADYDGDGLTDRAVYRPSNNGWYILQSSSSTLLTVLWGIPGDIPVSQDYDGDGRSDIAVYRPTTGEWFIIRSSNSTLLYVAWGIPGDLPIQGDFDGDGKADIGVYRPSSQTWFIIRSTNSTLLQVAWGIPGDVQVPADYDGDTRTDVAVYRPSTGEWFIIRSTNSTLLYVAWGGAVGMQPVPSDFDGDGEADIAVFFPANGTWYIVQSTNSAARIVTWP